MGALEKARKVMELTRALDMVDDMTKGSFSQIKKDLSSGKDFDPVEMNRVIDGLQVVFNEHKEPMLEILITGLVASYSDKELDAMIGFYSSKEGQSIVAKQNDVNQRNVSEIFAYNRYVLYPALQKKMTEVWNQIDLENEVLKKAAEKEKQSE